MRDHGSDMTNPKEQRVIVCALATDPHVFEGDVFHHRCGECNRHVMLSPSGQRWLGSHPDGGIICGECYLLRHAGRPAIHELAPGAIEELLANSNTGRPTKQ